MDNIKEMYNTLTIGIRNYFKKNKVEKAVIGLSGGIDSSLSAKLVADAIGKKNLHALIMPVKGLSSEENIKDAVEVCKLIGIGYSLIYINDFIKQFEKLRWKKNKIAIMNTASRIRTVILYNYANSNNALVIGTSNKTELLLGYFTKFGDGAVDVEVIGDLLKTGAVKLAKFLGLPEKIIKKVPTAELYHGQTDEAELGAPYDIIDQIIQLYIGKNLSANEIAKKGFNENLVKKTIERIRINEHKRNPPVLIKIS